MFTFFYTSYFYRVIKSGHLLDFITKKLFLFYLNLQFIIYNTFVEKYYVEFFFLRIKDYIFIQLNFIETYSEELVFSVLSVFLISVLLLIIFF